MINTDFFDMPEADVLRGPGGSPMLVPRGLEGKGIRSAYTRASCMADFVEDKSHIHKWEMRYLAKAMGQNEDLAALAACETYSTGISDATFGREKSASGRRLDDIIERAFDRVRLHEKADRGTSVHGFTEPRWWAQEPHEAVPERLRDPVAAFWEINRRECIEIVATECFTANDKVMSSGTFDHLVRVPGHPLLGGYVVADKKTGSFDPLSWAIQISTYANGEPYNTADDSRPGWPGFINLQYGLVWQIECAEDSDMLLENRVNLWVIDIALGWELAKIAANVRDAHTRKDIAVKYVPPTFEQRLEASNTRDDLVRLWNSINYTDRGCDEMRARVEQKARAL